MQGNFFFFFNLRDFVAVHDERERPIRQVEDRRRGRGRERKRGKIQERRKKESRRKSKIEDNIGNE